VNRWRANILTDNNTRTTMPATLTNAVLVFDGECRFCTACVGFLVRRTRRPLETIAYQDANLAALGLTRARCEEAVQWVSADGDNVSAHVAVAKALMHARLPWSMVGRLILLPGMRAIADRVYRTVATRRRCAAPTPPVG